MVGGWKVGSVKCFILVGVMGVTLVVVVGERIGFIVINVVLVILIVVSVV